MNAEQRQTAIPTFGPSRRTWSIGLPVGSYETTSTIVIYLLSPKADSF